MLKGNIALVRGREIQLNSAEGLKGKVRQIHHELHKLRTQQTVGMAVDDRSLREHLALQYQTSPEHLYHALGIDPQRTTVDFLLSVDDDTRWIVPELFRDAIRLGLTRAPIYPGLVAAEETIAQPSLTMPSLNLSDAEPEKLGEAETIGVGSVSYQSKDVKIYKQGIGLQMTYEAIQYSSINLLTIFLQDMGIKLGRKLDKEALKVLINGDQADGSQSAPTVGVKVAGTLDYESILKVWIRMSLIGRTPGAGVASERMAREMLMLTEFKDKQQGTPQKGVNVRTPIPQTQDVWVSPDGAVVTDNHLLFVDPTLAMVQLTSAPLLVESEKIVQRQINGTYASLTTGFANIFRDARILLDKSVTTDFPAWLNKG